METKLHLAYWPIRGLAGVVRTTLEATNAPYTETRYTDYILWFQSDKLLVTNPLPNLPILYDGDIQITEHDSIIRYVARKFKPELLGNNDAEFA